MLSLMFSLATFGLATSSTAATINAATCSYADVLVAVAAASSGDIVSVPAGTCTWGNRLAITKSVSIIGAGIDQTIINNSYAPDLSGGSIDPVKHLISIVPASPETNPPIRLSGFTFNFGSTSYGIYYSNPSTSYDCRNVRLDHLKLSISHQVGVRYMFLFTRYGLAHGVMDNCTLIGGVMDGGGPDALWSTNAWGYGTASNFYFEDNTWQPYSNTQEIVQAGNGPFRYAWRYNTIILPTDAQTFPLFDQHGNQYGVQAGCFGAEIYGNNIIANNVAQKWFNMIYDQRGGKSIVFNNTVSWATIGVEVGMRVREEHLDSEGAGAAINPINGQPQHISDSYYWGNTKNGAVLNPTAGENFFYDALSRYVPSPNLDFWTETDSFNGTSGVGVGLRAARPATCTAGVGYWATDESKLYRCTATGWALYYTPYTYPHPLRTDCGTYPTLCDADTTPPAAPTGVTVR